jgi:membrane protease YdiL (CAAX protease family)
MRPLKPVASLFIFLSAALLLWIQTRFTIPHLSQSTGHEPIFYWFLVGGLGVFLPLIILAWILLVREEAFKSPQWWKSRLFFRKMTQEDWLWTISSIFVIGALSAALLKGLQAVYGPVDHNPPFMHFTPPETGQLGFLALWFPYWILNIMGEEILWRGVMLPRQALAGGRQVWLWHGAGWAVFHIAFGWKLLIIMLPILFILPYVVQKRQNTWIGVWIHAAINGPSFIAITMGWL